MPSSPLISFQPLQSSRGVRPDTSSLEMPSEAIASSQHPIAVFPREAGIAGPSESARVLQLRTRAQHLLSVADAVADQECQDRELDRQEVRILQEEAERMPGWASGVASGLEAVPMDGEQGLDLEMSEEDRKVSENLGIVRRR